MRNNESIRQEIVALLDGGNAHMTFDDVVAEFPIRLINTKSPDIPYAPWHFLEHMRIAQWDILEFIRNPSHVSPSYPEGYRPKAKEQADKNMWHSSVNKFLTDLKDLIELAENPEIELFAPLPHAKTYTLFRELLLVADHNAYHIGEFALVRQVLNAWPPHMPYLTGTPEL
ncbi:MAG: DinB family protein [Chitinivibrionales bacterium]|nr:DinB family protein [Chitinivibrionales bacterium]